MALYASPGSSGESSKMPIFAKVSSEGILDSYPSFLYSTWHDHRFSICYNIWWFSNKLELTSEVSIRPGVIIGQKIVAISSNALSFKNCSVEKLGSWSISFEHNSHPYSDFSLEEHSSIMQGGNLNIKVVCQELYLKRDKKII